MTAEIVSIEEEKVYKGLRRIGYNKQDAEGIMKKYANQKALHIAEKAVEEHMIEIDHPFISIQKETAKLILSRIKELTEQK
ncbi:MAG TPA: hypothetical protein VLA13_09980 [Massilibacterium sp.]|nr:hypothetical protein [Massilibacterium sp.]